MEAALFAHTPSLMALPRNGKPELEELASPTSVMGEHEQLELTSVNVLIVGGGPHALAVLSALHERSFLFPQFASENMYEKRVGSSSLRKVGSGAVLSISPPEHSLRSHSVCAVCVMDPGETFVESWNKRFEALGIEHLRSPAFLHPEAFEPSALLHFAVREGRLDELHNVPQWASRLATEDMSSQEPLLHGLPSTALFRDFCASLAAKHPHQWLRGKATQIHRDESTGQFRVSYQRKCKTAGLVVADAVVLATGPTGVLNIPEAFLPFMHSGRVTHTESLLSHGKPLAQQCVGKLKGARVLVIGGGLTAAQAALAAVNSGCSRVVLRSRRPLQTRTYDLSGAWLDQRHSTRLRNEFLNICAEERKAMVKEAVQGGSVPESYMLQLRRLATTSGSLELQVDTDIDQSVVSDFEGRLRVNGEMFDQIILATGASTTLTQSPLYQQVIADFGAPTLDGFPKVDGSLRWVDDDDLFVVGANAVLELGPGALNLMGAMRGAKIVAEALRDLMWTTTKGGGAASMVNANMYAALGDTLDDGNSESDDESEEDEPAQIVGISVTAPVTPRANKATKAARKQKRASRPKRGRR